MITTLTAALILGLAGSLHCIGMCGPLVLTLPSHQSGKKQFLNSLVYQSGRIFTYGVLGFIIGFFGQSLSFAGLQQPLSLLIGILLLVFLLLPKKLKLQAEKTVAGLRIFKGVKKLWAHFFSKQTTPAFFMVGLFNGLLPCGLVYTALAGAAATGTALNGALFMVLFGLGTSPALIATGSLKSFFPNKIRQWQRVLVPTGVAFMALLLILRGANLGIPYLSPAVNAQNTPQCCPAP